MVAAKFNEDGVAMVFALRPRWASFVKDHPPLTIWLQTPDRIELSQSILPLASCTGPVLGASVPESSTSTWSGTQANGACGPSNQRAQYATTAALPRNGLGR